MRLHYQSIRTPQDDHHHHHHHWSAEAEVVGHLPLSTAPDSAPKPSISTTPPLFTLRDGLAAASPSTWV